MRGLGLYCENVISLFCLFVCFLNVMSVLFAFFYIFWVLNSFLFGNMLAKFYFVFCLLISYIKL